MKIIHICLAQFYIDDYSYQENIFPKMHKKQGHDVFILASTETFINNATLGYLQPSSYHTKEGIPITRLPYVKWLPLFISKKLRIYSGVKNALNQFKPDIIFIHDTQFISIKTIAAYARKNKNVKVYADGHADFVNSGTNWVSKNILHKIIYRWCTQIIRPYTTKFYGVLPVRVEFFRDVYKIPAEQIELLLMGTDTTNIDFSKRDLIRNQMRQKLGIKDDALVFVTGGKIDRLKNIHTLMAAVASLGLQDLNLIVFGVPNEEMKEEIQRLAGSPQISYVGWIPSEEAYKYFFAADVAFFPGTHSVLWEEAAGLGLPGIFKKWEGMQHIDFGGNAIYLDVPDEENIKSCLLTLNNDQILLEKMKKKAVEVASEFSYYEIAKKAIESK